MDPPARGAASNAAQPRTDTTSAMSIARRWWLTFTGGLNLPYERRWEGSRRWVNRSLLSNRCVAWVEESTWRKVRKTWYVSCDARLPVFVQAPVRHSQDWAVLCHSGWTLQLGIEGGSLPGYVGATTNFVPRQGPAPVPQGRPLELGSLLPD